MATSGNTSWELQRNTIISAALRKIGALAKGQSPDTEDISNGSEALNSLAALLSTDGMQLWKRTEIAVTLVDGQQDYTLDDALKVHQVVLRYSGSDTSYEIQWKSLYDFNNLPTSEGGTPVHYTFTPNIQDGTLKIWPTPDSTTATNYSLVAVVQKEFDGFFASSDTPDFPPYWTDALIYGLAARLAPEYGVPLQDRNLLLKEAEAYKKMASDFGDETGSIFFMADRC
jgi:hypothetical protein